MSSKLSKSTLLVIISLIVLVGVISARIYQSRHQTNQQTAKQTAIDTIIAKAETLYNQNPNSKNAISVANAYLQKVRETADVSYYQKIDSLMSEALAKEPNNPEIIATQANVALGRHDFKKGLELGEKTIALNPSHAAYYGIVTDAYVELGQYDNAVTAVQKMVDTRPDLSSYSRVAYVRELYGQIDGAKQALSDAISAGSSYQENVAWNYVELGKLWMHTDLDQAQKYFQTASDMIPNYSPALQQLGHVAYFKGDNKKAVDYLEQAFNNLPIAQYASDLGDIYYNTGDKTKAAQYYELAKIAFEKSKTGGTNTDQETAIFLADHDLDLDTALQKAQAAYQDRPSIFSDNALAWAEYKKGDLTNAAKHSKEALRIGENDAYILYCAGQIAKAQGDTQTAKHDFEKALDLNPNFSLLHAKELKDLLANLK